MTCRGAILVESGELAARARVLGEGREGEAVDAVLIELVLARAVRGLEVLDAIVVALLVEGDQAVVILVDLLLRLRCKEAVQASVGEDPEGGGGGDG